MSGVSAVQKQSLADILQNIYQEFMKFLGAPLVTEHLYSVATSGDEQ